MMGEAMNHVVCRFVLCVLAILIVAPVARAHANGGGAGSMAEPIFRLKRERRADPSAAAQLRLEIRRAQDELNRAIADARRRSRAPRVRRSSPGSARRPGTSRRDSRLSGSSDTSMSCAAWAPPRRA
jgi:hypothetical protein